MMEIIKFIVFFEGITMLVTGIINLAYMVLGVNFPILIYPIMFGIVLLVCLLVIFAIDPLADWFFDS